jgi:hypothetical protein
MTTYLNAPSGRFGTPTNAKKYTISTWLKLAVASTENNFFSYNYGSYQSISIEIRNDDTLRINQYVPGTDTYDIRTNRVFRDPSAWYHIVIKYDSTQSTASDRVKIYINGENQTSLAASSYPGQNVDSFIAATPNNNKGINIGGLWDSSGNPTAGQYFLGYMAQFIYTDGYAYDASTFGSTNANGIWVPNTSPSVTYGTNGFKLDFAGTGTTADASGFGADSSGNGNHFASNSLGTNPSTSDTCQNNFSTLNPLVVTAVTFSEGNCKAVGDGGNYDNVASTIAFDITTTNGWYAEFKMGSNVNSDTLLGICKTDDSNLNIANASSPAAGTASTAVGMRGDGQKKINGSNSSYGSSYTTGDIMSIAVKGGAIYFYKNGTIQNSGTAAATGLSGTYYMVLSLNGSSAMQANFGNPSYTIASGNADANGYGNFEYAVPSGYYALCTKNLAAYGG